MIDLKMWGLALTKMPRVDAAKWQTLDPIAKWLIATRASVLFMTFTAAGLGGLLAWRDDLFYWQPWLLSTLGLLFAHATNNLLNDYTDSRRGIDKNNYYRNQYGVHILEDGLVSTRQFWKLLGITGTIAVVLGAWLVWQYSGQTLNLMLAGAFFVLFYTWPLKYYGMGEPAVLLVWGPLMVGGTYYVVTGLWSWDVCWLSLALIKLRLNHLKNGLANLRLLTTKASRWLFIMEQIKALMILTQNIKGHQRRLGLLRRRYSLVLTLKVLMNLLGLRGGLHGTTKVLSINV